MRDIQRIDRIINKIRTLWYTHPDWRLGQLLFNLFSHSKWFSGDPFYIEDDELEQAIDKFNKGEK